VVASWSHPLRVIQGPKRRGSKRLARAVADSNPVADLQEFGSGRELRITRSLRRAGAGNMRGNISPFEMPLLAASRGAQKAVAEQPAGHESPTSRDRAWGGGRCGAPA